MTFSSINPATGEVVWSGAAASATDINAAVAAARDAFRVWSRIPIAEREVVARAFAHVLTERKTEIATAISCEVGKPTWEALAEVQSMAAKIDLSISAHRTRCAEHTAGPAVTRFRPHGVVAVFGPFNFPGHLPNGHIVPALLAGNTVVFKPSERAPRVAELMQQAWRDAGLPAGALQLAQGARETGATLAEHRGIDGLFFTGSSRAGLWLAEIFARTPERILALEMGGNNPLVVWDVADHATAALFTVQSAYLTAGQRCTCARRLIVPDDDRGDRFLSALQERMTHIRVGPFTDRPEPFMGPVISAEAAKQLLAIQDRLRAHGAEILVPMQRLRAETGLLTPGLIDVTHVANRPDEEWFGPLLQVIRVRDFAAAIAAANATRYGLAAGLFSDRRAHYENFFDSVRAGIVNWNQPLTGASSAAPFGGVGRSGNHRPGAAFAADYCSFPVASIERPQLVPPIKPIVGLS